MNKNNGLAIAAGGLLLLLMGASGAGGSSQPASVMRLTHPVGISYELLSTLEVKRVYYPALGIVGHSPLIPALVDVWE